MSGHTHRCCPKCHTAPRDGPVFLQLLLVLQGYTNYQLDPSKGTYARVPNQAPPFMGVNPSAAGKYTSFAQAPGDGQGPAVAQQVNPSPSTQCQNLCEGLEFQTHYHRYRF